jgi:hypothetical protein
VGSYNQYMGVEECKQCAVLEENLIRARTEMTNLALTGSVAASKIEELEKHVAASLTAFKDHQAEHHTNE